MGGRGSGGGTATAQVRSEIRAENQIRAAYRDLQKSPGGWVGMADLREKTDMSRTEFDEAIRRLSRGGYDGPGSPRVVPQDNRNALTRRERAAAVIIGGKENHLVLFQNPSPRPLPKRSR